MALLTTTLLENNGFTLDSNDNYTRDGYSVDAKYHLLYDDKAYPISATLEELQIQLDARSSGIQLEGFDVVE